MTHIFASSIPEKLIERYLKTTHASTHNDYTMTLMNVFRINKEGEESNFRAELPNRYVLQDIFYKPYESSLVFIGLNGAIVYKNIAFR